jgi:hypothetical protein
MTIQPGDTAFGDYDRFYANRREVDERLSDEADREQARYDELTADEREDTRLTHYTEEA